MFLSVCLQPYNPTKRVGLVQSRHHHLLIKEKKTNKQIGESFNMVLDETGCK
jgi:hypothetical protein